MVTGSNISEKEIKIDTDYFFEDQSFNPDNSSHSYHLSIELSNTYFAFSILDIASGKYVFLGNKKLGSVIELEHCLSEFAFLKYDFRSLSVATVSNKCCLVPKQFFDPSEMEELFQMNHGEINGVLRIDDLVDTSAFLIYEVDKRIEEFIGKCFPKAKRMSTSSIMIERATLLSKGVDEINMFTNVGVNSIDVVVVKDGNLILHNIYDVKSEEDVAYFLLNCMDQLNINNNDVKLVLSGQIEDKSELHNLFLKYVKNVTLGDIANELSCSEAFKTPNSINCTLFSQYLCA